jgi:hypothetical protein
MPAAYRDLMKSTYLIPVITALFIYLWGTHQQAYKVNTNLHSTDQSAYMNYAKGISQKNFKYIGSRNRMPVYPALMSFFHKDDMPDKEFFEIGKKVNTVISILVLIIFFYILRIYSSPFDALTAVLVTAFTVFAYKAPYFQAEILFYGIMMTLFALISSLLSKPRVSIACLTGLVGGIAHLTKASVIPALFLCLVSLAIMVLISLYKKLFLKEESPAPFWNNIKSPVLCIFIIITVFLITVFPYIRNSKEHFGHYFYNVNTTFYIWYDSWDEAKKGTLAFGDHTGWPDLPEEKIPGLKKYLREHNISQIFNRLISGMHKVNRKIFHSYGYSSIVAIYLYVLSSVFLFNWKKFIRRINLFMEIPKLFFFFSFFISYYIMYVWYTPIASGSRLILSLFMPFIFILVRSLDYAKHNDLSLNVKSYKIKTSMLSPLVLIALTLYMLLNFPINIFTIYGGD